MTTQLKVNRKDFMDKLKAIKGDNIQIADVVISRKPLLEALKLQTQPDTDILTLTYGKLSWWNNDNPNPILDNETCLQFNCNHTTMRFLNRPHHKSWQEPKIIPLNFVDYRQSDTAKPELTGIPIDTLELLDALNFVIHGVATEESRPVLCCVCFDCSKNTLQLATADGFRLPMATIKVKGMTKKRALIHRLDIPTLVTFLKNNYTGKGKSKIWLDTYIDIRATKTMFMSDKGKIEFDNRAGSYPDYARLIPNTGTHIQIIASEMLEAVKALNAIAKDGSGIIRLKFNRYPNKLTLSAKSEAIGDSSVECPAMVDRECYIAVNAKYLADFLSTCKDKVIDLFVDKPSSPMVCHNGIDQLEVIMPMFVQW